MRGPKLRRSSILHCVRSAAPVPDGPECPAAWRSALRAPKISGLAIASLVLGVLGFLTCVVTALPGLILGIIAAAKINASRGRLTGRGFAIAGIATSGVAILLSSVMAAFVLFPGFARARESERISTCQSNLKQCAQALKMYCDDFNGTMPSSAVGGQPYTTFGCTLCAGGQNAFPSSVRVTVWEMLYDYMRNKDIMWCPSDSQNHFVANAQTSYFYKYANDFAWNYPSNPKKKMSDYGYESDQIAFYEWKGWHYEDQGGLKAGSECNASFIDTHVEKIEIPSSGRTTAMTGAGDATSLNEPFFYNCYVMPGGAEVIAPDSITTTPWGQGWDPSCNYDKL